MTFLEINYRYAGPLTREQLKSLGGLPGQYGLRRLTLDEDKQTARIEYDASRLTETEVVHRVRQAGIPLTEKIEPFPAVTGD